MGRDATSSLPQAQDYKMIFFNQIFIVVEVAVTDRTWNKMNKNHSLFLQQICLYAYYDIFLIFYFCF